jgi:hypothetical protein
LGLRKYVGINLKVSHVTIFVTVKIQKTFHTQPVHVDMTHFRTKFHMYSSSCTVVTVLRPKATENVRMTTTLLCSFPKRYYLKIRCKSYHDTSTHITALPPKARVRSHLAISRVGHVVITQNTDLKNMSSDWPPMAYRLYKVSWISAHCFGSWNKTDRKTGSDSLTPWSRVLLEKLIGSQLVKKCPHFMQPEVSLRRLQEPATWPYPEPDQSSPCPPPPSRFLKTRGESTKLLQISNLGI